MNRDVVLAIYNQIKQHNVFMECWIGIQVKGVIVDSFGVNQLDKLKECGTVGCIAGTACILFPDRIDPESDIYDNAVQILGIDENTAFSLFYRSEWPNEFKFVDEQSGLERIFEKALEENSFEFMLKDSS